MRNNFSQPFEKTISVLIIQEYFPAFNTPHNYMAKGAWTSNRDYPGMKMEYQIYTKLGLVQLLAF